MIGRNILISRFFYSDFEYEYRATLVGAAAPTLPSGLAGFLFSRTSCDGGRCVCLISSTLASKAALMHFMFLLMAFLDVVSILVFYFDTTVTLGLLIIHNIGS